ncbi:hypothetical protein HY029_05165 [Candidatus Gottesmanbacteria bacterium]|nr:hypothetical protein [Candidatus Gottesmanbacteria bacterium]
MDDKNSMMKWLIPLAVVVLVGVVFVWPKLKSATSPSTTPEQMMKKGENVVDIKFANHPQMKLPEQDVYLESPTDKSMVMRVESDEATKPDTQAKMVYAVTSAVAHDPFKMGPKPLGPFPKGKALGWTLGQWLDAAGSGTYTLDGDMAWLKLSFTKLVPNSTYTVWCSRLTFPPNPKIVDRPCGATDGSENMFKTDASGNGKFELKLTPLEASTKETATVIALAYHSDGKTYGAAPGDFGLNSHVQMVFLMPVPTPTESK